MARTVEEGHISRRRAAPVRISACTCPTTLGSYFKQFPMQQLSAILQIQSGSDCPHESLFKIGLNPLQISHLRQRRTAIILYIILLYIIIYYIIIYYIIIIIFCTAPYYSLTQKCYDRMADYIFTVIITHLYLCEFRTKVFKKEVYCREESIADVLNNY